MNWKFWQRRRYPAVFDYDPERDVVVLHSKGPVTLEMAVRLRAVWKEAIESGRDPIVLVDGLEVGCVLKGAKRRDLNRFEEIE